MKELAPKILEFFYILIGFLSIMTGVRAYKDKTNPVHLGTGLFWILLGLIFAIGNFIPYYISGIMLVIMGLLTLFKQVKGGKTATLTQEEGEAGAKRLGSNIFIPSFVLAVVAMVISSTPLGGQVGVALGSTVSLLVAMVLTKATPKVVLDDTDRMFQAVSTTGILPQLLAALGIIFTTAGVGDVISKSISSVIPEGHRFFGVVAYCVGMAVFTMIMGNAFAAFTVITAGIGIPFVIAQGGDPLIAGTLAMTAGFCGTLITPMAANFNALPAALLEMEDDNAVIKTQIPVAISLFIVHIILMYYLAF